MGEQVMKVFRETSIDTKEYPDVHERPYEIHATYVFYEGYLMINKARLFVREYYYAGYIASQSIFTYRNVFTIFFRSETEMDE